MDALVPARAGRRNTRIGTLGMAGLAIYLFAIRPWQLRWGAADAEVHQAFPGDDCVPRPRFETTRAVTIRASAADVWAWLVQLGSDRAGYYSYDWLEKRLGLDITNVDRIVPEFQKREVGDRVLLGGPDASLRVAVLHPGRHLVLSRIQHPWTGREIDPVAPLPAHYLAWSWTFILREIDADTTRLIVRVRADYGPRWLWLAILILLKPTHFIMERKMLLGIKERAEVHHELAASMPVHQEGKR